MPRVNIYIRNDDWETWEAIANKPEWLHGALNGEDNTLPQTPKLNVGASVSGSSVALVSASESKATSDREQQPTTKKKASAAFKGVCPVHDIPLSDGKCFQKGCKYA